MSEHADTLTSLDCELLTTPPENHLEFALLAAERFLDEGKAAVAITQLLHCVHIARFKPEDPIDDGRLRALVSRIVTSHGGFA